MHTAQSSADSAYLSPTRALVPPDPPPSSPLLQLVINISAAFSAFKRWSVGLGVEHQLSELRQAVGLPDFKVGAGRAFAMLRCRRHGLRL